MGTKAAVKRDSLTKSRADAKVLEAFGIRQMQDDVSGMSTVIGQCANSLSNLGKKHDDLVKKCADDLTIELKNGGRASVKQVIGWHGRDIDRVDGNLTALNEVRNRSLLGRLKWLATGR